LVIMTAASRRATDLVRLLGITGYGHVGGLAGYNGSLITDCYNAGAVSGDRWIGGLVSYNAGWDFVDEISNGTEDIW